MGETVYPTLALQQMLREALTSGRSQPGHVARVDPIAAKLLVRLRGMERFFDRSDLAKELLRGNGNADSDSTAVTQAASVFHQGRIGALRSH
jgi:hypothetical protein